MMQENQLFHGILEKVRIISNNICYGPSPAPDEEVEQRVTIRRDGRVWISRYAFGTGGHGKYQRIGTKRIDIGHAAEKLLDYYAAYFSKDYEEAFATDIGDWSLCLTNVEGRSYHYAGSLCAEFRVGSVNLSDITRRLLEQEDLFLFDGNGETNQKDVSPRR